jgi:undecaprenyl diphosphate synthase
MKPAATSEPSISQSKLPRHIAVIMDGNGRWARKRGLPRVAGHRVGLESVRAMVKACSALGISHLTLYAFSSENWRRPRAEVSFLMKLLQVYLRKELEELHLNQVKIQAIGRTQELPLEARRELKRSMHITRNNPGLVLTLALNYGGRQEILDAARKIARDVKNGKLKAARLDEAEFSKYLDTCSVPDPDLLIRTSGEYRLSNFLLWQSAYSEIFITPVLWPDFRKPQLMEALHDFQKRERRFGDISSK